MDSQSYIQLHRENSLGFVDKLFARYHENFNLAKSSGVLKECVLWLEVSLNQTNRQTDIHTD